MEDRTDMYETEVKMQMGCIDVWTSKTPKLNLQPTAITRFRKYYQGFDQPIAGMDQKWGTNGPTEFVQFCSL